MKKGEIYQGIIEKIDFPNKGKVYLEDGKITVKNGIPGQKVRFVINKKKGRRLEGRLLEVLEKSPLETREPVCSIFPACGGCMYQTMPYEEQLKMKAEQVKELLDEAIVKGGQTDGEGRPDYLFQGITRSLLTGIRWNFPLEMNIKTDLFLWAFTKREALMTC